MITFITCQKASTISLTKNNHNKIIAIQPFDDFNEQSLSLISKEVSNFFHAQTIVLKPITVSQSFRYKYDNYVEEYSADSLIRQLSKLTNDSVVEVIGFTHKNIYVPTEYKLHLNNKDSSFILPKIIFGLGYVSGNSCIITDSRLISTDTALYLNRLRKVILHEMGHNLGLQHCSNETCIMSESNGNIVSLNKTGGDYCENCKRRLH